jgi:hypothetical protein
VTSASFPVTPAEAVNGVKLTTDQIIAGRFGRLVMIPVTPEQQDTQDDVAPRSEWGLIVGFEPKTPTNRKIFLLNSETVVTRRYFESVPVPSHILNHLKRIADRDAQQLPSTPPSEDHPLLSDPLYMQLLTPTSSTEVQISSITSAEEEISVHVADKSQLVNNMSISQALAILPHPLVHQSVETELNNLTKYDVWNYLPANIKPDGEVLPCKLFLKLKYKPDGAIDKLKSRLVAGGHRQKEGTWDRTPSTNVDPTIVLFLLSVAHLSNFTICTSDIPSAFLNAKLKEKLFMRISSKLAQTMLAVKPNLQPYLRNDGSIVVSLNKCIYGLHQAPLEWSETLFHFFKNLGFSRSTIDRCVFFKLLSNGSKIIVLVHVDDLMIFSNNTDAERELKTNLQLMFGDMKFDYLSDQPMSYIGLSLQRSNDGFIELTQKGYCNQIIKDYESFRGKQMKSYVSPSTSSIKDLRRSDIPDESITVPFLRFTYSLLWVARMSHPELLFTIGILTTLCAAPPATAFEHLDRAFGYLSTVVDEPLRLKATSHQLAVYADASFALHNDGKSHSGIIIQVGGSTIYVGSEKQKFVTLSACESETAAVVSGDMRTLPLSFLKEELQFAQSPDEIITAIFQDNQSTIRIVANGEGLGGKSRTFRVKYGYLKERLSQKAAAIFYLPTNNMLADIPSKPAMQSNFRQLTKLIKNIHE